MSTIRRVLELNTDSGILARRWDSEVIYNWARESGFADEAELLKIEIDFDNKIEIEFDMDRDQDFKDLWADRFHIDLENRFKTEIIPRVTSIYIFR